MPRTVRSVALKIRLLTSRSSTSPVKARWNHWVREHYSMKRKLHISLGGFYNQNLKSEGIDTWPRLMKRWNCAMYGLTSIHALSLGCTSCMLAMATTQYDSNDSLVQCNTSSKFETPSIESPCLSLAQCARTLLLPSVPIELDCHSKYLNHSRIPESQTWNCHHILII
jgi:hypothetical protein